MDSNNYQDYPRTKSGRGLYRSPTEPLVPGAEYEDIEKFFDAITNSPAVQKAQRPARAIQWVLVALFGLIALGVGAAIIAFIVWVLS